MTMFMKTPHIALACVLGAALLSGKAAADQVIPDDLIVLGSTCIGFDCVNNMSFGSDTLILRENQLRIFFSDSSVGSFPTNDWRLLANGAETANFFALQDEGAGSFSQVFRIDSGAASGALRIDQFNRVGLGTNTPVLKLHLNFSDTPGTRYEQNGNSGFTPQTWDVAGNEVNFFVRDVTGGSRLPFRIRPGAPTSSIDIAASGSVGIGTASPANRLDVLRTDPFFEVGRFRNTAQAGATIQYVDNSGAPIEIGSQNGKATIRTSSIERLTIDSAGNVGIGTTAPGARLHTTGSVRFAGVANCGAGIVSAADGTLSCLASSMRFKNLAGELAPHVALANVMALRPQTGAYKDTPDVPEHWLIAEDVAAVDPALVGLAEGKPHVVKTQNIVADLVAVVQQQQRRIDQLERRLAAK
jgi:hypothetical protein